MFERLLPVHDPDTGFCLCCKARNFPIRSGRTGHGHSVLTVLLNLDDSIVSPCRFSEARQNSSVESSALANMAER
jgi:hypothetical protein